MGTDVLGQDPEAQKMEVKSGKHNLTARKTINREEDNLWNGRSICKGLLNYLTKG